MGEEKDEGEEEEKEERWIKIAWHCRKIKTNDANLQNDDPASQTRQRGESEGEEPQGAQAGGKRSPIQKEDKVDSPLDEEEAQRRCFPVS